jgi:hypothetical protein
LILPGTGRWQRVALTEGAPSTPELRSAVPLPVPGRNYSAAIASNSCAARYFSASSAAMQPVPAAVTAWR